MFSKGMQPVMFSVTEAKQGRPGWVRAGQSVCYYRNLYFSPSTPEPAIESNTKPSVVPRRRTQSIGPVSTPASKTPTKQSNISLTSASDIKSYFSIRFTIRFRHPADVCYVAYHYPYTFSYLQVEAFIAGLMSSASKIQEVYFFQPSKFIRLPLCI